jgi:hypothetical protein
LRFSLLGHLGFVFLRALPKGLATFVISPRPALGLAELVSAFSRSRIVIWPSKVG